MKKEERARMRRLARWLLPPGLLCAGYALWVGRTGRGPACPIHAALGLWCPLCGASRMGLALLRRVPAKTLRRCAVSAAAVSAAAAIATACAGDLRLVLWSFTDEAALEMLSDAPARLVSLLSAVSWPVVTLYAV